MIHVHVSVGSIARVKNIIVGILAHVFCENNRYLKSTSNTLVIVGDEIINVRDSLSANVTNTIPTNVKSTVSINSNDKKVTCEKSNWLICTISLVILCL